MSLIDSLEGEIYGLRQWFGSRRQSICGLQDLHLILIKELYTRIHNFEYLTLESKLFDDLEIFVKTTKRVHSDELSFIAYHNMATELIRRHDHKMENNLVKLNRNMKRPVSSFTNSPFHNPSGEALTGNVASYLAWAVHIEQDRSLNIDPDALLLRVRAFHESAAENLRPRVDLNQYSKNVMISSDKSGANYGNSHGLQSSDRSPEVLYFLQLLKKVEINLEESAAAKKARMSIVSPMEGDS